MIPTALLFLLFAFIHSITVSSKFKNACKNFFGDTFMRVYYRALYNSVSLATAIVVFRAIHQLPDHLIWIAPFRLKWLLHATQVLGLVFGALSFQHLDGGEFLGIRQVWRYISRHEKAGNAEGLTQKKLVTTGVYGIVRHPLYLAGIILVTASPRLSVNGLTLTILADLYFAFGMLIEERRFIRIFGDQYREYVRRVPRILPWC
jgi:hypothetical protein